MANIQSGASADILTVDPLSKALRATLYGSDGTLAIVGEGDQPGAFKGVPMFGANDEQLLPMRLDRLGSLAVASHQPLFTESFEGATIHPIRWAVTATTMAATQAPVQGLLINSGNITTINTGYMIKSNRAFLKSQRQPLQGKIRARLNAVNNSVMEVGFFDATTFNGANTTGAYWQVTSSGAVLPVVTYNSVDITGTDVRSSLDVTKYYTFDVFMDDDEAVFYVQDSSTGLIINRQSIKVPVTAQRLWSSTQLPIGARLYNTAIAPASAPQLIVTDIYVAGLDSNASVPLSETMALMHRDASTNPQTGAQLAAWANSAEPANATLSNTAAGYTTLGGKFQFAAVAGAVTDFALFGFQVPSPSTLVITGIDIEAWNTVVAVATTPTLLTWGIATNLTAVSLATASHARVGLGAQSFAVGAAPGATAQRISKQFRTPLVCGPGRFVDIILRIPVGTATATEVFAGMVNIEGYFI